MQTRLPRCPKCREQGPTGLCQLHAEWYADLVCMDCGTPLTDENYSECVVSVGPAKEPWEDETSFAVIARTADVAELVCEPCRQIRLAASTTGETDG